MVRLLQERLEELDRTRVYMPDSAEKTHSRNAESQGGVYALARTIELIETLGEQVKQEEEVGDNEQERDLSVR